MKTIQSIRGMNDLLPDQSPLWHYVESTVKQVLAACGYSEIRMPIVEQTHLFKRSIGEVTDIVEKEMYTFEDRNGDSLSLRPEGTASCVRACLQHGLINQHSQRLWYAGPMFRHERPQKGRYRQFEQIGVETFGLTGPDIDAELIMMTAQLWKQLGIDHAVTLQLNSIGSLEDRQRYRADLVTFLESRIDDLDTDSQKRLSTNPLRILDSKNPATQAILQDAPVLTDYLGEDSKAHFERLQQLLSAAGLAFEVNPSLVRGLDYYCKTVFEWVTDALGAQGTICAGGRLDGLVEQLGGKPTPACGFAMGVERLVLMVQSVGNMPDYQAVDAYLVLLNEDAELEGLALVQKLRSMMPTLKLVMHCGGGSLKSQMKKADKSGAKWALMIGEDELKSGTVTVKDLRDGAPQQQVSHDELVNVLM